MINTVLDNVVMFVFWLAKRAQYSDIHFLIKSFLSKISSRRSDFAIPHNISHT